MPHEPRDIPWLKLVQFHKEIAERNEEGFFAKRTDEDQARDWSFIRDFQPDDMSGAWKFPADSLISDPFRNSLIGEQHEALFAGGPGFCTPKKNDNTGQWDEYWNPIFYTQVSHRMEDDRMQLDPEAGKWYLSPVFIGAVDRLQLQMGGNLEELGKEVIEEAVKEAAAKGKPLGPTIKEVFCRREPDLKPILNKTFRQHSSGAPTQWGMFAPIASFSPLNKQLMKDYVLLEKTLVRDPNEIGGLKCLEDLPFPDDSGTTPIPIVPLNKKQEKAVGAMLGNRPVTVVSGPPGCGKSQVVVSLLLNAWANGQSVMFASNNNKAVNVVLERLEEFESDFPIAVRAGNRKENKVVETLRRILNMAADAEEDLEELATRASKRSSDIEKLEETLSKAKEALDSGLPTRISETVNVALSANAEEVQLLAQIKSKEEVLTEEKPAPGRHNPSPKTLHKTLATMDDWWEELGEHKQAALDDEDQRNNLTNDVRDAKEAKLRLCSSVGMETEDVPDWSWLEHQCPEELDQWAENALELLTSEVVPNTEEKPDDYWLDEFNEWRSEEEAATFAEAANNFSQSISENTERHWEEIPEILGKREELLEEWKRIVGKLSDELSLSEKGVQKALDNFSEQESGQLDSWLNAYATYKTSPDAPFWNLIQLWRKLKLRKGVLECEKSLLPLFSNEVRLAVGAVDWENRPRWNQIIASVKEWFDWKPAYERNEMERERVEGDFKALRNNDLAAEFECPENLLDTDAWRSLSREVRERAKLGEEAATAWGKHTKWIEAEKKLKVVVKQFGGDHQGNPLWMAWVGGEGLSLKSHLSKALENFGQESAQQLLRTVNERPDNTFRDSWKKAREWERNLSKLEASIAALPSKKKRIQDWWSSLSASVAKIGDSPDDWPTVECEPYRIKEGVREWLEAWEDFTEREKPELQKKGGAERKRAKENLESALALALESDHFVDELKNLIKKSLKTPEGQAFPANAIHQGFSSCSEQEIRNRLEKAQSKLKSLAFEGAKDRWLKRLSEDTDAKKAINDLMTVYRTSPDGSIPENKYPLFKEALKLAPIWITVPASPQSIPMVAGGFDLIVVDEATQCSITNLLPILHRGKRLAVIGDEHQLRAIPNIRETEEDLLAKKHDVEDWVSIFGHCEKDVYTAGVESIPSRLGDVVMLLEHYRSHPQIIGFANTNIYRGKLVLSRPLNDFSDSDGVYAIQVPGQAEKGDRNRSWRNRPEAEKIVELITANPDIMNGSRSAGVVTPFRPQQELITKMLNNRPHMDVDILVGTAYTFQGDERDIVYFSPVVAPGMTPGSIKWACGVNWKGEEEPNLINVAITRARDALFIVGDFDYLSSQRNILGRLAKYAKTITLLRDSTREDYSPCELAMFTLMCAEGWQPKIQIKIGDIWVDFILKTQNGANLVIETDGREHHENAAQEDALRDNFLKGQGYLVIRIHCKDVFEKPTDTIARIWEILEGED